MAEEKEKPARDLRQEFTDKLVVALEEGKIPWRKPWDVSKGSNGLPANGATGKTYRGGNSLMLMMAGLDKGYADNRWVTFKQAQALGGYVRAGEKATPIEYWEAKPFYLRNDVSLTADGKRFYVDARAIETKDSITTKRGEVIKKSDVVVEQDGKRYNWRQAESNLNVLVQRTHYVFNVEQAEGLQLPNVNRPVATEIELHEHAENIVKGMMADGLDVKHGTSAGAFYKPGVDAVFMPPRESFENSQGYYGTLLHELGHATGHESRLKRPLLNSFGSKDYAKEELVAEITSAFTSIETGIPFDDENHKAYVQNWAEVLKNDKNAVFAAARDASKASDYMLDKGREYERSLYMTTPEPLISMPGATMQLDRASGMVQINIGDNAISFGGVPAIEEWAAENNISKVDLARLVHLDAEGSSKHLDEIRTAEMEAKQSGIPDTKLDEMLAKQEANIAAKEGVDKATPPQPARANRSAEPAFDR